jgi:hypothetical protein
MQKQQGAGGPQQAQPHARPGARPQHPRSRVAPQALQTRPSLGNLAELKELRDMKLSTELQELALRDVNVGGQELATGCLVPPGRCAALAQAACPHPGARQGGCGRPRCCHDSVARPPPPAPAQAISYVSRRRMDQADFDPNEVDEDGLPLVYNEERIAQVGTHAPGPGPVAAGDWQHRAAAPGPGPIGA